MGDRQVAPPQVEGILKKGAFMAYVSGGPDVNKWFEERLREMPEGAYVRFTAEVLDPHPDKESNGHRDRKGNDHDRTGDRTSPQP